MKLKYRVRIKYYDFEFDDAQEAVQFCLLAKMHQAESRDDYFDVRIDFITVSEEESAEDPEDDKAKTV